MQLNIKVEGSEAFIAKLRVITGGFKNWADEFSTMGEYLVKYYSQYPFFTEGEVFGERWPELAESTVKEKAKDYQNRPMLIRTKLMSSSFAFSSSSSTLLIYNSADYFAYHQSSEPRTKLPRRAMMAVNKEIVNEIRNIMVTGIRRRMNVV